MKNLCTFPAIFLLWVFLPACSNEKKALPGIVDDLANIECRAFSLRNQRFSLANNIRFSQDSLSQLHTAKDSAAWEETFNKMNKEKDSLLAASLKLADSVKLQLDFIMLHYLTDKQKEKEFNRLLDEALIKRGCK